MSITKGSLPPNLFLFLWMIVVSYLIYIHLNRPDFRDEVRMLWQLQEIANDQQQKESLPTYININVYLDNLNKASNDPSVKLVNRGFINKILKDSTLSYIDKCHEIMKVDLNKVIKLNYGEFKWDEKNVNYFGMYLRDICTGDFNLDVNYSGSRDKWKIQKMLLYELD